MAQFEIRINDRDMRRKLGRMQALTGNFKAIKPVLRKAAKPWAEAANSSVYNYVKRDTGNMGKAIGIASFESERRGEVGVKARPKPARRGPEKNAGWRAHFFATPARHIRKVKRIPWNTIYATKDGEVIANVVKGVRDLFKKLRIT